VGRGGTRGVEFVMGKVVGISRGSAIVRSWLRGLKRRRSVGRMLGGVVLEGMAMVVSSMETRGGARSGMNGGVAPSVAASGSNSAQVEAAGGDGAVFD